MKFNAKYSSSEDKDIVKKKDIYKYEQYKNKNTVFKTCVKDIDLNMVKPHRAGVIIYTKINNEIYFGLGVDTLSGEYTDFGGGVSYKDKKDKHVIDGALREFHEETLGIFGKTSYYDIANSYTIYNNQNLIVFYYMNVDPILVRELFTINYNKSINNHILPEVSDIQWVSLNEFKQIIATRGKMFHRVQLFLQQAGDIFRFFINI